MNKVLGASGILHNGDHCNPEDDFDSLWDAGNIHKAFPELYAALNLLMRSGNFKDFALVIDHRAHPLRESLVTR